MLLFSLKIFSCSSYTDPIYILSCFKGLSFTLKSIIYLELIPVCHNTDIHFHFFLWKKYFHYTIRLYLNNVFAFLHAMTLLMLTNHQSVWNIWPNDLISAQYHTLNYHYLIRSIKISNGKVSFPFSLDNIMAILFLSLHIKILYVNKLAVKSLLWIRLELWI